MSAGAAAAGRGAAARSPAGPARPLAVAGRAAGDDGRPAGNGRRRVQARVEGTVQGVGFRPFVFRLVADLGLGGWVRNDERGVLVEVEGDGATVERFLDRLAAEAPPLAVVEQVRPQEVAPTGEERFAIVASAARGAATAANPDASSATVPVDTATCDDCLRELFDPADRRYRYPFVNCTDCGPRFTIVRGLPYDRPLTTMVGFPLCADCRAEYEDPRDRRFHAEPIACPACGPHLALTNRSGKVQERGDDALTAAAVALAAGRIVAVKGLGGFHLACRADDPDAVALLRERKRRPAKPFAVMVRDLAAARRLIALPPECVAALAGRERPILLAPRRAGARVAEAVAPGCPDLGVMLPYTPLHHLLLAGAGGPLVMTSGNHAGEPIVHRDDHALRRLGAVADCFLLHDRPIETRADDSVLRLVAPGRRARAMPVRRSRGFVPAALPLPVAAPWPLLACGAELKNTWCLARGDRAWLGPHVGDLGSYEAVVAFGDGVRRLELLLGLEPAAVAHDLHPDYASTRWALDRCERRPETARIEVQHHHAHLAAVLAEHGCAGPAAGAIFDGTGYGPDGSVWGGEILVGDLRGYRRAGHLWPVRLPGGNAAVREPWRMACAWLAAAQGGVPEPPPALASRVDPARWQAVARLAASGFSAPWTTSAGRLFDAVAALCGLCTHSSYEGEAAVALEAAAARHAGKAEPYPLPLVPAAALGALDGGPGVGGAGGDAGTGRGAGGIDRRSNGGREDDSGGDVVLVLDARETVRAVAADLAAGVAVPAVAARFHAGLAAATVAALAAVARRHGIERTAISGGVFQNRLLLEAVAAGLERVGLPAMLPTRVPLNDGGIAFGQAAVAAARLAAALPEGGAEPPA